MQGRGVRKDVAVGEAGRLRIAVPEARDPVVQQSPAGLEQARELRRIKVDLAGADVLDHSDARDRVEALGSELAVVHDADLDTLSEPGFGDALACKLRLP